MHRIHRSVGQRNGGTWLLESRSLRRAERPDPYRARLHGCLDLHDPREDHPAHRWGFALVGSTAMDYQDIRDRRRDLTADAVLRYIYIRFFVLANPHQDQ